jgi:hypothetical protein
MIIPLEPSAAALQVLDAFDNFFQKFHQGTFMDRMHVVIVLMSNWCCILQVQTLNALSCVHHVMMLFLF